MYVLYEVYGLCEVCKVYQEYIIEGKRGILDTSQERESIYFSYLEYSNISGLGIVTCTRQEVM